MFAYILEPPISKYTPNINLKLTMQYMPDIAIPLIDFGIYRDFWSSVVGTDLSRKEFLMAGDRIHILERHLNCREGINKDHDTLPPRFLNELLKDLGKSPKIPLDKMLKDYYKIRGYDENGVPKKKKPLKKTGNCLKNLGPAHPAFFYPFFYLNFWINPSLSK